MTYYIEYSSEARQDLYDIHKYIMNELMSPETASQQINRILNETDKLDVFPLRHQLCSDEPWNSKGIRFFPVDNYLVFYKTDDETEIVYVVRIMYGGRDVHKQLSQTEDV